MRLFLLNTESMKFLEKDLEEIIFEADNKELMDRGLLIYGKKYRQLRIGNYGIADLVTVKRRTKLGVHDPSVESFNYLDICIFELKKDKVGISALLQAVGYARGIQSFLEQRGIEHTVNIILVGKEIDTSGTFCYITNTFDNVWLNTYNYNIDGIKFNTKMNYKLTDEGFRYEN